jgi:hypothetical protein
VPAGQSLSDRLRTRGFHRGFLGTSRPWLVAWVVLVSIRYLRKYWGPNKPELVYSSELKPGESLLILHEEKAP